MEALRCERVGEAEHVGDERLDRVVLAPSGPCARRDAAQIRRHRAVARTRERRQHAPPRVRGLGEAVQQQHELARRGSGA
jgi:hypothetical protein